MDKNRNPFSPGAGTPPPELAGRSALLDQAELLLHRTKQGRYEKSLLMVGLRGVGKTVLLNRIRATAENTGYVAIYIEVHENKTLPALLAPKLRQALLTMDMMGRVSTQVKRGLRVLRSFLGNVKVKAGDIEISLDVDPEVGTGDSGDLEHDLPDLIEALGEAGADRGTPVVLIMDELQYLRETELSALIMAMHRVSQHQLPVAFIGAGLPQLVGLAGKSKSYAERLFDYPPIDALDADAATDALQGPVQRENAAFTADAIDEIRRVTKGYAYFLQEWGYQAWNVSNGPMIDLDDVREATLRAIRRLDTGFFRVRFDRTTPAEKNYMRALAELGSGPQRSGDIADMLGVKVQSIGPVRNGLIKKGMIYSPAHGDTEFTVPLFDEYMKRTVPWPKPKS
ncbi:ATP-binding protein [Dyella sp. M7H15-1]|uniref:ATP-binding protein n=1 Tax=Dyella sp. M7H15-1 TaxID=2501295 RepID=UPI001004EF4B|nr:ATP-binding protein [Dyella sp. M7H15-1]QAU24174.1 ATP-binding protein [Dyella sp. M7H15-1]